MVGMERKRIDGDRKGTVRERKILKRESKRTVNEWERTW